MCLWLYVCVTVSLYDKMYVYVCWCMFSIYKLCHSYLSYLCPTKRLCFCLFVVMLCYTMYSVFVCFFLTFFSVTVVKPSLPHQSLTAAGVAPRVAARHGGDCVCISVCVCVCECVESICASLCDSVCVC